MPHTPIDKIPFHLMRKRGKTFVSIGPEPRNITGFKSRLWNVTYDDRYILVRWGKSVISNNRVNPVYLHYKLHQFNSKEEVAKKLNTLILDKTSPAKGYQEITRGFSLKPANRNTSFGKRSSSTEEKQRCRPLSPEIFISYAHRNRRTVHSIVRQLEAANLNVWVDHDDMIEMGQPFGVQIQNAIKEANSVVIMMTRQANQSDWVALEATYAKKFGKQIIAAYLQPIRPLGVLSLQLKGSQRIPAYGKHRASCVEELITELS